MHITLQSMICCKNALLIQAFYTALTFLNTMLYFEISSPSSVLGYMNNCRVQLAILLCQE